MSTKPIREALERIQCTCRDHSCVGCKAEAAISAIERAAKVLAEACPARPERCQPQEWSEMVRTIDDIAENAP